MDVGMAMPDGMKMMVPSADSTPEYAVLMFIM